MKVKILIDEDSALLEQKFNSFSKEHNVLSVSVHEDCDIVTGNGYIAYHVFYEERYKSRDPRTNAKRNKV